MSDAHIQTMIAAKTQHLWVLEEQKAAFGDLHVPVHVVLQIEGLQREIAALHYQRTQIIYQTSHLTLTPAPLAKGLIALMSPSSGKPVHELATYQAIDYHRGALQRCWLIATAGERGSQGTAEALATHFTAYRVACSIHTIVNGADAAETHALIMRLHDDILKEGRFAAGDIIADITAGTKAMTAGMVLACGTTWPMQCMFYQHDLPSLPVLQHMALDS